MKTCLCGAPMRIVSEGRGYVTYGCSAGCDYYLTEEQKEAPECVDSE